MNYLTRGKNITPDNKPKIVIYAAQEDYEQYYQKTAGLLLEKKNCAVIRYSELSDSINPSELDSMLKQDFVLIVCIVTNRLVDETPDAADILLKANALQLPVLPILWEALHHNDRYNELFENRQFLAPTVNDETAISFGKKLSDYLNNILADDETLKRIDEEFRDRIFLSYRKANRAFANELFKIIHSDPALTDVGVWYDEYIEGGDDFEADITKALKNSKIFLLCITHKLLSEPNYVTEHEYPNAVELGLPVVSIEMEPSLSEFVQERLYGLDGVIPFFDKEALLTQLKKLITPTEHYTAEHCYYVGLAYLNMRYVEYDPSKALSLIRSAMEKGLPEAALTLASMYSNGQGVSRSYEKNVEMNLLAVELMEKRLSLDPDNKDYQKQLYVHTLTLAKELQRNGQRTEATRLYKKIKNMNLSFDQALEKRQNTVDLIGEVQTLISTARFIEALTVINKIIEIREKLLYDTPRDFNSKDYILFRRDLSLAYLYQGDCLKCLNYLSRAEAAYIQCMLLRQEAYLTSDQSIFDFSLEAKRDYVVILTRLANLYEYNFPADSVSFEKIYRYYLLSLQLREELYAENQDQDKNSGGEKWRELRDMSAAYYDLGHFLLRHDNAKEAIKYLKLSVKKHQDLYSKSKSYTDLFKLADVCKTALECFGVLFRHEDSDTLLTAIDYNKTYFTGLGELINFKKEMKKKDKEKMYPDEQDIYIHVSLLLSELIVTKTEYDIEHQEQLNCDSESIFESLNYNMKVCKELIIMQTGLSKLSSIRLTPELYEGYSANYRKYNVWIDKVYAKVLYLCARYMPLTDDARHQYLVTSFEIYQRLAQNFPDDKDYAEMSVAVFTLLHEGV